MEVSFKRRVIADSALTPATAPTQTAKAAPTVEPKFLPDHLNDPEPAPAGPAGLAPVMNLFGEMQDVPGLPKTAFGTSRFHQHTTLDEGFDSDVAVDPEGQWLVYASSRNGEHANLYAQQIAGGPVTQLTSNPADDAQPTFSPDGKRIAFCSNRGGAWDLFLMNTDGGQVVRLTNGSQDGSQNMHPSFSPDGTRLVFCSLGGRGDGPPESEAVPANPIWEIWTLDLNTQARTRLTDGLFPAWSPSKDADRIVFQRARQRGSRWFSLWTVDVVQGQPKKLMEVAVSSNSALISPVWSPDGRRLAFASITDPAKMNAGKPQGQTDIWVLEADYNTRRRLTDGRAANLTPIWAVDNRVYFISDRGGHENVWSVAAEIPGGMTAGGSSPKGVRAALSHEKNPARPDGVESTSKGKISARDSQKNKSRDEEIELPNRPAEIGQADTQEVNH